MQLKGEQNLVTRKMSRQTLVHLKKDEASVSNASKMSCSTGKKSSKQRKSKINALSKKRNRTSNSRK